MQPTYFLAKSKNGACSQGVTDRFCRFLKTFGWE